jgi:DNA-binding IclR family transcriptional regulator
MANSGAPERQFESSAPSRTNGAKSASRALDVLELLGAVRQPVRAKQVANALALHPSSVNQLLKTMVNSGYLIFDPIKKLYRPSPRLTQFASWLVDCYWGTDVRQILGSLCARTHGCASITVRSGNSMCMVEGATENPELPRAIGLYVPFATVAGQAFLASRPEDEACSIVHRAALFRQIPQQSCARLMEQVREARELGYARGASLTRPYWSIAIPFRGRDEMIANSIVLGVTGPKDQIISDEAATLGMMRDTLDAIVSVPGVSYAMASRPSDEFRPS